MHKQSFAECHSLSTKAPLTRPIHAFFVSKFPKFQKRISGVFVEAQEFENNKPRDFNCKSLGFIF